MLLVVCPRQRLPLTQVSALTGWGMRRLTALGCPASLGRPGPRKSSFTGSHLGLTPIVFPYTAHVYLSDPIATEFPGHDEIKAKSVCGELWGQLMGPGISTCVLGEKSICRIGTISSAEFAYKPGLCCGYWCRARDRGGGVDTLCGDAAPVSPGVSQHWRVSPGLGAVLGEWWCRRLAGLPRPVVPEPCWGRNVPCRFPPKET